MTIAILFFFLFFARVFYTPFQVWWWTMMYIFLSFLLTCCFSFIVASTRLHFALFVRVCFETEVDKQKKFTLRVVVFVTFEIALMTVSLRVASTRLNESPLFCLFWSCILKLKLTTRKNLLRGWLYLWLRVGLITISLRGWLYLWLFELALTQRVVVFVTFWVGSHSEGGCICDFLRIWPAVYVTF